MRCCLILRIGNNSRVISFTIHTAANNPTAGLDNSSVLLVAFRGLGNLNCSTKFTLIAGAKVSPSAVLVLLCYSSSSSLGGVGHVLRWVFQLTTTAEHVWQE